MVVRIPEHLMLEEGLFYAGFQRNLNLLSCKHETSFASCYFDTILCLLVLCVRFALLHQPVSMRSEPQFATKNKRE